MVGQTDILTAIQNGVSAANTLNRLINDATLNSSSLRVSLTSTSFATNTSPITNSLGGDVLLNNTANYFDGPSVAQGTVGTWFVSGTVTVVEPGSPTILVRLWDGTNIIASAINSVGGNNPNPISLSGYIVSPAGNLRFSARDPSATTGKMLFNQTGDAKDSTITAFRLV
jgi:hypothetical protein